jgi:hypothetical protein
LEATYHDCVTKGKERINRAKPLPVYAVVLPMWLKTNATEIPDSNATSPNQSLTSQRTKTGQTALPSLDAATSSNAAHPDETTEIARLTQRIKLLEIAVTGLAKSMSDACLQVVSTLGPQE